MIRSLLRIAALALVSSTALPTNANAASVVYPVGIVTGASNHGVYSALDTAGCCWLARSASFLVRAPAHGNLLLLTIEIPPYALENAPAAFDIRIGSAPVVHLCCFDAGQHELAVPVSKARTAPHMLRVHIRPSTFFVPAERGINQDTRELTVLLQRVELENSATGTQYIDGHAVGTSPSSRANQLERWLIFLLGGIGSFVLARKRLAYAWVALLASAPFMFSVAVHGTTLTLPKAVLIGCLAASLPVLRQIRTLRDKQFGLIAAAFAAFFVSSAISAMGAVQHHDAIRETLKILEYLALFILAFAYYRADPDEMLLRRTLCWLTIAVSALALAQLRLGVTEYEVLFGHTMPRIAGPLGGPNQLGAFLAVCVTMVYGFALTDGSRRLARVAIAVGIVALALTFSRGGALQLAAGIAVVYALRYRQMNRVTVAIALGAVLLAAATVALAVAAYPAFTPAHRIFGDPTNFNGGLGTRTGLWPAALHMWQQHPVFGVGPGNFEDDVGAVLPGVRTHPNSYFMQLLAEQGLAGLLLFTALTAAAAYALFKSVMLPLCASAIAMLFGMALHQVYDGLLIYPKIGVFYWVLLGCAVAAASRHAHPAERRAC